MSGAEPASVAPAVVPPGTAGTALRLGIDIGGTKTEAVAIDGEGRPAHRVRLATGHGSAAVLDTAVRAANELERLAGASFASVGVGIPGMVTPQSGLVRHAVNLGFEELELGSLLGERLGKPVLVENDVKAATLGAYRLLGPGIPDETGSMAYLNLGTGVAAGFVVGGALWRGARGTAGEIGHIPVDPQGSVCACGQRGCLETVASGSAVARLWPTSDPFPAHALFQAAAGGDRGALSVVRRLAGGVATAVRLLVLTLDVDTVVVGGGLAQLGDRLVSAVRGTLVEWGEASSFVAALRLPERVRLLPDGMPAAAVGAALVGGGALAGAPGTRPVTAVRL